MPATILGLGMALPKKVLTNFDLEKMVDTSDKWIFERTGIKERRVAENESCSDLGALALKNALIDADLSPEEVDALIVASGSPEMIFPSTACLIQEKLGLKKEILAFDLQAACSGFLYGLAVADALINSKAYKKVALVGAEKITAFVDWEDRNTCVLFGDGAGAAIIGSTPQAEFGLVSFSLYADGSKAPLLCIPAGGSGMPASPETIKNKKHFIQMQGREVFKLAVKNVASACQEVLKKAKLFPADVDFFLAHQANERIINAIASQLGLSAEKIVLNISRYGNTSAASIPIALTEIYNSGKLKKGSVILLAAFGSGLTWGAALLRWSKDFSRKVKNGERDAENQNN